MVKFMYGERGCRMKNSFREKDNTQSTLPEEVLNKIEKIKEADIVVGIPSFRSAKTIAHVVKMASEGMVKYFSDLKPVLVNSDGGSTDRTREVVLKTEVPRSVKKIITPYMGTSGKGTAFQAIFEIADRLKAKVVIVVDSDLRSISPEWIQMLGEPILKYNYGFVTPYYLRYKYDGTITNSIAYPLTRSLYGKRIRQPIGGEFGITGGMAKILSHQRIFNTDIARFGIDIWLTTTAINEGFNICQSAMGVKLHNPKSPTEDLSLMFVQVVGTLLAMMKKYEPKWKLVRDSKKVDIFGTIEEKEPEVFQVDVKSLHTKFCSGLEKYKPIWEKFISKENIKQLHSLAGLPVNSFHFPEELWAMLIYDFASAYNFYQANSEKLLKCLLPIYYGRTAGFINETKVMSMTIAEALVEGQAEVFEKLKPYLIARWDEAKHAPRDIGLT